VHNAWKIDKHINISVIVAVCLQFAGVVYWVSSIDHQTSDSVTRIERLEDWREKTADKNMNLAERTARTEQKVESIENTVSRMESKLDQALSHVYKTTKE